MQQPPAPDTDSAAIWLLAVGQTLGYAALLYIFAALLVPWEQALGWSKAQLALGPTLSILVSAAMATLMGRLVDRGYGAELLTGGAVLGTLALVLLAMVRTPAQFVAVWGVIGVAHSACLYEVCFAFLIRRLGAAARPLIIRITLVAGFASTLAFPAGAYLSDLLGWRGAVYCFAASLAMIAAPANLIAGRRLRRGRRGRGPESGETPDEARQGFRRAMRNPMFWMLALAFGLVFTSHSMLVTYFIPLFTDRGASPAMAVAAASCVGPAQVVGRLLLMFGEARVGTAQATRLMLWSLLLASGVLWCAGLAPALIFLFAGLQGAGVGLMSILRPVLTAEILGRNGFGAVSGAMAMAPLLGAAAAPFMGALVLESGGARALIGLAFAMVLVAMICTLVLFRLRAR